jgi:hypothetical protein
MRAAAVAWARCRERSEPPDQEEPDMEATATVTLDTAAAPMAGIDPDRHGGPSSLLRTHASGGWSWMR